MRRSRPAQAIAAAGLRRSAPLALLLACACATNPATGRRQFVLMSESQEIAMGQEAAPAIAASMGIYADEALGSYVEAIGMRMAKASERPQLPWQFRVVDDPLVNAFAVPGGFIYVTRGILAHMDSEAELAGVLGHEIGHVTARHSVAQYTKSMGAQLVLLPAVVLLPELGAASQLLGAGLQVLMLKYGRDDERQSDELGLRYMTAAGSRPEEMVDVFRTLDRIGAKSGGGDVPEWLSTHPSPANRVQLMSERIARIPGAAGKGTVGHDELLRRLDGMVYGENPREGYFGEDGVFHHPDLAFRVRFPKGWKGVNQRSVVGAMAPEQDGVVQLTLAKESTPDAAARAFLSAQTLQSSAPRSTKIGGLSAVVADFAAPTQQGGVRGAVAFVAHGDHVFELLGAAPQQRFADHESALRAALASFTRETSAAVLGVQPWRIDLVTPKRAMSPEEFAKAYPGPAPAADLALMNQIPEGGSYAAGVTVKRVVGKPLP
jgi:predicted Zn-dependent protease